MKILLSLISAILLSITSIPAQSKYNKTTMEEMNVTSYAQDTTATAVVLLKEGDLEFIYDALYGFRYQYTLSVKIKILKTQGLDYANQEIFYNKFARGSEEDIRSLSGTTYNVENGKIVKTKLSKEHIFDSSQDDKHFLKKFTMPAAKVGSIIEYKYTLVSDFYYEIPPFKFQGSIPIEYISYCVTIPEWFDYNTNMQGYERVDVKETPVNKMMFVQSTQIPFAAKQKMFTRSNMPALKSEPFVWYLNDYCSQVTFELRTSQLPYQVVRSYTTTWPAIDKKLLENSDYGGNTKKTGLFKDEIIPQEKDIDNARRILNIVKSKVKWNDKDRFYPSGNLKNVLKDGLGSSADMNFLYINALKAGGFDAYPVMISTRDNGRLPIVNPSLTAFNYTLTAVKIDTLMYYVDASAKYSDMNIIPKNCMVEQARILDTDGSYWVDLTKISTGTVFALVNLDFKEDGLNGAIGVERNGNSAYDFRLNYFSAYKDKDDYVEKLGADLGYDISGFEITGDQNTSEKTKTEFNVHKDATLEDEFLYINPLVYKAYSENPFKSEHRLYPIQFDYQNSFVEIINIAIPEGYAVEELPKSERISFGENRSILFTYIVSNVGDKIAINYQFQVKTLTILPTEYEYLKQFFAKIVAKNNEQIVLKKL